MFDGSCHIVLTIIRVLLALTVGGMGFDSYIIFGTSEITVIEEKNGPFGQPGQALKISECNHLLVWVGWLLKMRLKADEKRAEEGFHNAPQDRGKVGESGEFKIVMLDS